MRANSQHSSPLASRTLASHLARGCLALGLIVLAVETNHEFPLLAASAGIAAIVMLRGCPMCWTIGLWETWIRRP